MKKVMAPVFVLVLASFWGTAFTFAQKGATSCSPAPASVVPASTTTTTTPHHAGKAGAMAKTENIISGTISMVDADQKIVVLTDSNGVPFDFKVTPRTHIVVNGSKASLSQLADQTNKQASVKFVDRMKAGQFALTITVTD